MCLLCRETNYSIKPVGAVVSGGDSVQGLGGWSRRVSAEKFFFDVPPPQSAKFGGDGGEITVFFNPLGTECLFSIYAGIIGLYT